MPYKLRQKQIKAAQLLARGTIITEIDRTLTLRRGTLLRWKQQPAFMLEYEKALEEQRQVADFRKAQLLNKSVETLYSQLNNRHCDPKVLAVALNVFKSVLNLPETVLNAPEPAPTGPKMSDNVPT